MPPAGVSHAPEPAQRERAWVDFGVDDTWEPAPPRRPRRNLATGHTRSVPGQFPEMGSAPRPTVNTLPRPVAGAPRTDPAAVRRSAAAPAPVAAQRPRPVAAPSARPVAPRAPRPVAASTARPVAPRAPRPVAASTARPVASPTPAAPAPAPAASAATPVRRTVTIRGRGAERDLAFPSYDRARRPATRRHERPGFQPDRTAMWAVMLGLLLVLVACASAHATALPRAVAAHHGASAPRVAIVRAAAPQR
jgi:hypothetical protein